jgi:hypothetical protein
MRRKLEIWFNNAPSLCEAVRSPCLGGRMDKIKAAIAVIAVAAFISFAAAMALITHRLAHKICDQNGKDYSVWRDRCVDR